MFPFLFQILPTAQRLLDELLSTQQTAINTVCGAPGILCYICIILEISSLTHVQCTCFPVI
jgi:hypothetical protein